LQAFEEGFNIKWQQGSKTCPKSEIFTLKNAPKLKIQVANVVKKLNIFPNLISFLTKTRNMQPIFQCFSHCMKIFAKKKTDKSLLFCYISFHQSFTILKKSI